MKQNNQPIMLMYNEATARVLTDYQQARNAQSINYNQFNGRTLYETINDWQKRWNGYIPPTNTLLSYTESNMFINLTRNVIIGYLSQVAANGPEQKIICTYKKNRIVHKQLSTAFEDLNTASLIAENYEKKFFATALEATVKGTAIVYEGYKKEVVDGEFTQKFNAVTGKVEKVKKKVVVYDDVYQETIPLEDFYIANVYQPDIQKQAFCIWRCLTTYEEAKTEFAHYLGWDKVVPGNYSMAAFDGSTFYRSNILTDYVNDRVEILRYYNRSKNRHIIICNGVTLYDDCIPFKHGRYPFTKAIFEPFDNYFFYGAGFPNKIMGEQDLINTFWNLAAEKTFGSLLPFVISSDLDDFVDDPILRLNQIRKVGDINKWRVEQLPGVNAGESNMIHQTSQFLQQNANSGGASGFSPNGGRLQTRQIMLQQQESLARAGFSARFLEDCERERTELRLPNIIQFYSIPRIEMITGKNGKEMEQLMYRQIKVEDKQLSTGQTGTKIYQLVNNVTSNKKAKIQNDLSVLEAMGEEMNTPLEAIALDVSTFEDFWFDVQVVRKSSYDKNQALEQAMKKEYATWRVGMAQIGVPTDLKKLTDWVDDSFDIPEGEFDPEQQPQGMATLGQPPAPGMGQGGQPPQPGQPSQGAPSPMQGQAPSMGQVTSNVAQTGLPQGIAGMVGR